MSNQPGLSDYKRYEAFTGKWRSSVLKEAEKWCSEEQAAQLLTEAVLAEFRNKYADKDPPLNPEYHLRAQVCLVYSQTGQSIRRLSDYLAMQETAAEAYTAQETPASEAQTPPAVQPDTFFDPVRTTLWTPDSSRSSHVVKELEIPDEDEDGRSVLLSFLNTVLLCSPQAHSASAFMRRELF